MATKPNTTPERFVPVMPPCHGPCGRTGVVTEGGLCRRCRAAEAAAEQAQREGDRG